MADSNSIYNEYNNAFDEALAYSSGSAAIGANSFLGEPLGFKAAYENRQALLNQYMANAYNSAEAQKSRDFNEYMSSTAYQRAAKDLQAVGFSPFALLGSSNSASAVGGSAAHAQNNAGVSRGSGAAGSIVGGLIKVIGLLASKPSVLNVVADSGKTKSSNNYKFKDSGKSWEGLLEDLGI